MGFVDLVMNLFIFIGLFGLSFMVFKKLAEGGKRNKRNPRTHMRRELD